MNKLRERRELRRMTQTEVAERLGLKQETVSQHETGRRGLSASTLCAYAELYGATMDDLYSREDLLRPEPAPQPTSSAPVGDARRSATGPAVGARPEWPPPVKSREAVSRAQQSPGDLRPVRHALPTGRGRA